jgi:uncharacterized protein (TIGR03437 family)
VYVADTNNHCIRLISGSTITTFAGTGGTAGYTGDAAAATSAKLNQPSGLALDSSGNLYIADTANNVIRKVAGTTITTVVGNQGSGAGFGGDGGVATLANLNTPTAIAFDAAGNMYIADTGNSRVRKVDAKTNIITTYVGESGGTLGTAGKLDHPTGVWVDASGALYIADSGNARLARFVPPTSFANVAGTNVPGFAGDLGLAVRAQLNKPTAIAMDGAGNIYVADTNNSRIRKINPDGIITTIAGKGGASYTGDGGVGTAAGMSFPRGLAVDASGTVYVADSQNNVIRTLTPTFPAISPNGVTNAASYATKVSPGALASVFGSAFGVATYQADDGYAWPLTANQVSVKVNGVAAPLYFVSPGQINFQVPWETPTTGTVNVSVVVNGGSSNVVAVPVGTAAPGLFYLPTGAAIVQNTPSYTLNDSTNPAPVGSTIIAYLTGSGPVSPAVKNGTPTPDSPYTMATSTATAKIGTQTASVAFTGLTPGFVGLAQMNIVVPSGLAAGVYPLTVTIDGQTSNSALVAVK